MKTATRQNYRSSNSSRFLYSQPDNAILYDTALWCKTTYAVYNILQEMMNKKTHIAKVRVLVIAQRIGRSRCTVQRHLRILHDNGIIERILQKSPDNPRKNVASLFIIHGRHAERYIGTEYGDPAEDERSEKMILPSPQKCGTSLLESSLLESESKAYFIIY